MCSSDLGSCQEGSVTRTVILTLAEDRAPVHLHLRKHNHLYVKIPSDEIGLQPVENKAVEKMALMESEKQPSSGRKNGCTGVGNVAPSKVTEKYKSNKYYEVNYCYGKGESL